MKIAGNFPLSHFNDLPNEKFFIALHTYRCARSVSTIWKLFRWRTTSTLPSVIRCMNGCCFFRLFFVSVLPLYIVLMLTFTVKSHQLSEHFGCEVTWVLSFREFQNPFNRATRPNEYSLLISSKSNMIASCFWAFTRLLLYFLRLLPLLFLIFFCSLLSLPFGSHQRRLACSLFIFTTARHYCSTLLNECDFVSYCFSVHMKVYPYIRVHIFSFYGSWLTIYTYSRTRCSASVLLSLSHTLAYFLSVAFDFPWMGRIQKRDCRHCFRSTIRYIRWSLSVYDYYQHRLAGAYSYCHSIFISFFEHRISN